jgi:GDP-L-fucose synthase
LKKEDKIFVAGARGLVGSAIAAELRAQGCERVQTPTHKELDLECQEETHRFLREENPDVVVLAAAKVGGINANNTYPAEFIQRNLIIEHNVIWGSHLAGVPRLLLLGSSCVYPRECPQPIIEDALLTGKPEPTNAPFAIAKIAGIFLCDSVRRQFGKNYFAAMLPNIYGPNDNFDLKTSHVLPALIRKFHEALPDKPVQIWGTGKPRREFLHSADVANACVFLLGQSVEGHINVGTGSAVSIAELAQTVQRVVGHTGPLVYDTTMPDGFPEKTMDVAKLTKLGWKPRISLDEGIRSAYEWYKSAFPSA